MDKEKLIHQLFVGKVADIIGFERTTQLLKDSRAVFEVVREGDKFYIDNVSDLIPDMIWIERNAPCNPDATDDDVKIYNWWKNGAFDLRHEILRKLNDR